MHTKKELDILLNEAGIAPNKKMGQNFLVNPRIVEALLNESKFLATKYNATTGVEIGPGLGALTFDLQNIFKELILCEIDHGLVDYWLTKNFKVESGDALKLDWPEFEKKYEIHGPSILVSNLPYQIAASLVMEMSFFEHRFEAMVLMFQKEVAERIQANTQKGDYGMLSVVAQSFWDVSKVIDAGPQDFHPVPNVGSRVLSFQKKPGGLSNPKEYITFVKLAFSQPRKKMLKNLASRYPIENLQKAFESQKIDANTRAEQLEVRQIVGLFNALSA